MAPASLQHVALRTNLILVAFFHSYAMPIRFFVFSRVPVTSSSVVRLSLPGLRTALLDQLLAAIDAKLARLHPLGGMRFLSTALVCDFVIDDFTTVWAEPNSRICVAVIHIGARFVTLATHLLCLFIGAQISQVRGFQELSDAPSVMSQISNRKNNF